MACPRRHKCVSAMQAGKQASRQAGKQADDPWNGDHPRRDWVYGDDDCSGSRRVVCLCLSTSIFSPYFNEGVAAFGRRLDRKYQRWNVRF